MLSVAAAMLWLYLGQFKHDESYNVRAYCCAWNYRNNPETYAVDNLAV